MEEKKLTDEEIVKALECLTINGESNCCGCKFYTGNGFEECIKNVAINSISLIHRLQGEKAEYERKLDDGEFVSKDWHDEQVGHYVEEIETQRKIIEYQDSVEDKCAELKRQVDELLQEKGFLIARRNQGKKQAVKDTAKEILQNIMNIIKKSDGFLAEEFIRIMAKQNDVEVE